MSQIIVKIDSKTDNWNINRRYRVGQSVTHKSLNWSNLTGSNTEPGIGLDWLFLSSVNASSKELFTATASQTDFVLTNEPNNVDVYVDRVYQLDTIDFSLSGNTVTMVEALKLGSKLEIRKFKNKINK